MQILSLVAAPFHSHDKIQIETAPHIPNLNFTTQTTSTHENRATLHEQAKPKATPHTEKTLQRNPSPTEIITNQTRH